ncbi:MAG TPA: TetR/AcrR family transcriptional regulator [Spirochaetota bacterium]|nr:TetR/AcrR family transcriptional regulator [Spirochaetota bacterium]
MPKGFTEKEKILIRARLLEKGRELFTRFGLKKTSVGEITKLSGISKGAFYLFYETKEEFFFEILEKLEDEMRRNFDIEKLIRATSKRDFFRDYLRSTFKYFEEKEILNLFTSEDMQIIIRKIPAEKIENHIKNDNDFNFRVIESLKKYANMRSCDDSALIGMFKSLFFIFIHKNEIGGSIFDKTVDLYIDMIVSYLIEE